MIDLAKPLGIHNDLVFYGDHELADLVYYFPDEVRLARQTDSNGEGQDMYELLFQIFHEGTVNEGGIEELRKTAGSILQLGVQCKVSDKRLEKAVESLKNVHVLPEDLKVATPHWKDGSVNLIALDAGTMDRSTLGEDSFVKSIIGSNKPSLMSADLKSIFNVRFDRRGTALISSALEGAGGSVAGVLYDLKYTAIRPSVDLRIWADLGRCYDSVSHEVGVHIEFQYYVKFSIGAEFEWLTKKMEENGDLKVELLSQVEDAETKKLVDEMVKEFKESILKELFRPYVNPSVPEVTNMSGMTPEIGVSYAFKKEKIDHGKIIEVDYRERSTTTRTHNPQSHLWLFGRQITDNRDRYIKKVIFSDLWREQELQINLINDFDVENNDLLSAEVIIWRKRAGKTDNVPPGRFAIPDNADPLKNITFHKDFKNPVKFSWLYDTGEEIGYYYQIRFLYSSKLKNISSPAEIVTEPFASSNQNLIIFPETYTFYKQIEVRCGNISFDEFSGVDIVLRLKDSNGEMKDVEVVTLNEENKEETWIIRGPDKNHLFVEVTKEFHFKDGSPSIKTEPIYLIDDEVIVNRPLKKSIFELLPVIAGKAENVKEILLKIILDSPTLEEPVTQLHRFSGPGFNADPIKVRLNSNEDKIFYEAQVITDEGKIIDIGSDQIKENVIVLDLKKVNQRNIAFIWDGPSPEAADLKYLRVELRSVDETGKITELDTIEYKGDKPPETVMRNFDRTLTIEMKIVKRFYDGSTEKGQFETITEDKIIINSN
ncbi:MAG: hypothetical protein PHH93_02900 [Prolixibacteraceae bacterium]|nr:hypothetical protein [Prolixibacteraceae bacterium]